VTAGELSGGYLDGFTVGFLPVGVGELVSDFTSEWEDVRINSRVWERQVADGYQVDLRIHVLRGERLADLASLRDFLAEYHEIDPGEWPLIGFQNGQSAGLIGEVEAFWLFEPGIAVEVRRAADRFSIDDLRAVADGVQAIGSAVGRSDT